MRELASPFALGTRLALPVLVAGFWLAPAPAAAQTRTIVAELPDDNGPVVMNPGPFPALTIGTFTYALLPGETIAAAEVSGTWGNSSRPRARPPSGCGSMGSRSRSV